MAPPNEARVFGERVRSAVLTPANSIRPSLCPKGVFWVMRPGRSIDGAKQMAAIIPLHQTSKWAKQQNLPPIRQRNQASRTREYLTSDEVERSIAAARHAGGRLADRDALLIMMAYRHGLRASELIALRWDQIDLKAGTLHVARLKRGSPSTHPLRGPELRALRAWKREQGDATPYVFTSLRGGPMTRRTVHHVVAEAAKGGHRVSGPPPHAICLRCQWRAMDRPPQRGYCRRFPPSRLQRGASNRPHNSGGLRSR